MRVLRRAPSSFRTPTARRPPVQARAAGVESTYAEKTATVRLARAGAERAMRAAKRPGERTSCKGWLAGGSIPDPLYLSASRHSARFRTKNPPSSNVRESAGNSFPLVSSRSEHVGESSVHAESSQAGQKSSFRHPKQLYKSTCARCGPICARRKPNHARRGLTDPPTPTDARSTRTNARSARAAKRSQGRFFAFHGSNRLFSES